MKTNKPSYRGRCAIYGGSFDPVHTGHLRLALAAVEEGVVDRTIFMPNAISPFKRGQKIAPGEHRAAMLRTASAPYPELAVSSYELDLGQSAYTIETLEVWEQRIDGELYFLLGMDSMLQIDTWYRGEEILRRFPLITANRPGEDENERDRILEQFRVKYDARIHVLKLTPMDYSSSEIRARITDGESVAGLVPPGVEEYIRDHGLYR